MSHEKTSLVIKKIDRAAQRRGLTLSLRRRGGNHTIYEVDGHMVTIPNGTKVTRVEATYRQLVPVLGKGWWRE